MIPIVSIIAAMTEDQRVIGVGNTLPWHLPEDLKHFRMMTTGHSILMGRKTYESIGRPLPKRENIVITRNFEYQADGCVIKHTLDEAIAHCSGNDEIFIIGGSELYKQALSFADRMYLTEIIIRPPDSFLITFEGDSYFPEFNLSDWKIEKETKPKVAKNISYNDKVKKQKAPSSIFYRFVTYCRKIPKGISKN
jgi:dihydrofolate reductase